MTLWDKREILTECISDYEVCVVVEAEDLSNVTPVERTKYWSACTPHISYGPHELEIIIRLAGPLTVRVGWLGLGGHLKEEAAWCLEGHVAMYGGNPFIFRAGKEKGKVVKFPKLQIKHERYSIGGSSVEG